MTPTATVDYSTGAKTLRFRFTRACAELPSFSVGRVNLYSDSARIGVQAADSGQFRMGEIRNRNSVGGYSLPCTSFIRAMQIPQGSVFDVSEEDGFIVLTPRQEEEVSNE